MKLYIVLSKIERLELSTLYTKHKAYTTKMVNYFKIHFHHYTYPISIFIHSHHASHAMHVRQMAIMHYM